MAFRELTESAQQITRQKVSPARFHDLMKLDRQGFSSDTRAAIRLWKTRFLFANDRERSSSDLNRLSI